MDALTIFWNVMKWVVILGSWGLAVLAVVLTIEITTGGGDE